MKRERGKRTSGRRTKRSGSQAVSEEALKDVSGGGVSPSYGHIDWKYTPEKVEAKGENIK